MTGDDVEVGQMMAEGGKGMIVRERAWCVCDLKKYTIVVDKSGSSMVNYKLLGQRMAEADVKARHI